MFRQGQQEATLSVSKNSIENHGKNANVQILSKLALFCSLGCLWSLVSETVVCLGLSCMFTNFAILIKLSIFHLIQLIVDCIRSLRVTLLICRPSLMIY